MPENDTSHAVPLNPVGGEMTESEDEMPSLWAHVVLHPETHTPAELPPEAVEQVNELLNDWTAGYFIDRCWIKAGVLDA